MPYLDLLAGLLPYELADVKEFALKNPLKLPHQELIWAANHLHFRQKLKHKVPAWYAVPTLISPPLVSIEQSSSELTARWKARQVSGRHLADLTGGMGVDTYFFSRIIPEVIYVEQNPEVAAAASHNFNALEATTIQVINNTAEAFLASVHESFDVIYLDPARRDTANRKMVGVEDCEPNIIALLPLLRNSAKKVVVKYSPMLDISLAIRQLKYVHEVQIISVKNEVKELLFMLNFQENNSVKYRVIELSETSEKEFAVMPSENPLPPLPFAAPHDYLYEPAAGLMKLGMFDEIARRWNINKLAPNSHLYTGSRYEPDFFGRIFNIIEVMPYDKKLIAKRFEKTGVSVATRNFPLKPEEIRKQCKLKDGQEYYLFFTEASDKKKITIITEKY